MKKYNFDTGYRFIPDPIEEEEESSAGELPPPTGNPPTE